ncbi:MAG: HemK2/MTQ2 family protein methyltransferase [Candidatus Micrarchaeaceae archaeon]|jgi:release factor glutamine methyltransferase
MEYAGLNILTNDNVYIPAEDSFLAADMVRVELDGMEGGVEVLEIGCGTGILGLVAAANVNVKRVVFTDINDDALELCKANIQRNSDRISAECEVIKSDLFSNVEGMFDMIIFNAPYLPDGDNIKMSEAWYGGEKGIEVSEKFINSATDFMKTNGKIVLIVSSLGDLEKLRATVNLRGLTVEREQKVHVDFEDIIALVLSKQDYFGS